VYSVPDENKPGKRLQEIDTYSTTTRSLLLLSDHLRSLGITRVVMEATSDYWKPIFYLLEADDRDMWLVNAKDVKHLPGRPRPTSWTRSGCARSPNNRVRPSFVPPPAIRHLRDLTRYRIDLINTRIAEKNRVEELLEDACIKLSVVASDIFGVSGRDMMAALIAGERDPKTLAQLARSRMRTKITLLEEAFTGHFTDHHAFLLARMLSRVDAINADIAAVEDRIGDHLVPFAAAVDRLDEIPGIGPIAAAVIIAEIGVDMSHFPTAGHLVSWARFAPGVKESAGKNEGVLAGCGRVCRRGGTGGRGLATACHARRRRRRAAGI
jgi:transposase